MDGRVNRQTHRFVQADRKTDQKIDGRKDRQRDRLIRVVKTKPRTRIPLK